MQAYYLIQARKLQSMSKKDPTIDIDYELAILKRQQIGFCVIRLKWNLILSTHMTLQHSRRT